MGNSIDRREWLKRSSLVLAGLGLTGEFFGADRNNSFYPANSILLNSNENAYGPSPLARKAILDSYLNSNRYPDELLPQVRKRIAQHWSVNEENILLGAGSSDIIGLACVHVSKQKGHVVVGDPSYRVWNGQASAFGLDFNRVPLNSEKKLDLPKMAGEVNANTRMIYICNPNNPTGTYCDQMQVSELAKKSSSKTMVFVDEAYTEFAELESLAPLAIQDRNIIVAKTFSKIYGLAGARVGYAIAHPETIQLLGSYQYWPDAGVSVASGSAAMASLDDKDFVRECREKVKASRETCYAAFKQLAIEYIPSHTNFILFNIDKIKGNFSEQMQSRGIYVQFREHFGGKWCRVSIGTTEEMKSFVSALMEIAAA